MELGFLAQAATLIAMGFAVAVAALYLVSRLGPVRQAQGSVAAAEWAFLFDGETLVDASDAAQRMLQHASARGSDLMRLAALLAPRFPDLSRHLTDQRRRELELFSTDGRMSLTLSEKSGRLHLKLEDLMPGPGDSLDAPSLAALIAELQTHRAVGEHGPVPVWRQTAEGAIVWANTAYMELAEALDGPDALPSWPPRALFDQVAGYDGLTMGGRRLQLTIPKKDGEEVRFFECHVAAIGDDLLYTAIPVDRAVDAERSLRDFTQTLTQTFAHLSVGLAIFDRERSLSLFNPALSDLIGLKPDYLIGRPSLSNLLDQLRERQMMPEPKDYKSWRQQMVALEAQAATGVYSEPWFLPDGRTFQVTGRPHPDGAVAFVFEDISADISLRREYKTELETCQAVFDGLDEAIAVFSPAGTVTLTNQAYRALWGGEEPDKTIIEASRRWQHGCAPTPVWGDARDFCGTIGERSNWTAEVRLSDGRGLDCRFEALPGGATLVGFSIASAARPRAMQQFVSA